LAAGLGISLEVLWVEKVDEMKVAIISGSDKNYFPLLIEMVQSVRSFPESRKVDICIMDVGLTPDQKEKLGPDVTQIVSPDWPAGIPEAKTKGKDYLKACVCRPFIPQMFPGYDVYLWMDCDTWVQDWFAVEMFVRSASKGDRLAITNGADRSYPKSLRISWIWRWPIKIRSFYNSNGKKAFGWATAKKLIPHYVLSAACFAMSANAPHWKRWQEIIVGAAGRGKIFPAEQLSLGKLVHLEGYKAEYLSASAMWQCQHKPFWNKEYEAFVEPNEPYAKLGILHLSGVDEIRADRSVTIDLECTDGSYVSSNYRYPRFDGGRLMTFSPERV
tara:strand:+ start:2484 stop:3473 length:990 start_codon:yes stop_codon:yes gene_type:complete